MQRVPERVEYLFQTRVTCSLYNKILIYKINPNTFDKEEIYLEGPGLSVVLFLRSGTAREELEFSLLLAETDVESLALLVVLRLVKRRGLRGSLTSTGN